MKTLGTMLLIGSAVGVLVVGCSSEETDPGSGGKGGASAGKSGGGGKANGSGGKASGGAGGKADGGAAGQSGSGGDGGRCMEPLAERPLNSSCEFMSSEGYSTVDTTCSFADTCDAVGCGTPFGMFDAAGCVRPQCESSDICASGERCVPSVLHGNDCYSAIYEGCEQTCDRCNCVATEDCAQVAYCLKVEDYPPDEECDLSQRGCDGLSLFVYELERTPYRGDTADAVAACRTKVLNKLADCNGQGGSGGQGGNAGAGAGGESGHGGQSGHGGA